MDFFNNLQSNSSAITILFSTFLAGILTSLTPCVYPLTPIIVGIFSANKQNKFSVRLKSIFIYILGLLSVYVLLGIITAKLGVVFGSYLANPFVLTIIVLFLAILALYTLDLVPLRIIDNIQQKAGNLKGGMFVMGAVSGLIAAPCVGPVLAGILVLVAKSESILWGGLLLGVYGLGLSLILITLALFTQSINFLPKSGNWLYFAKFIIASALFAVSYWLLTTAFPTLIFNWNQSTILFYVSLFLILSLAFVSYNYNLNPLKLILSISLGFIVSSYLLTASDINTSTVSKNEIIWLKQSTEALNKGKELNRLVMIDVFADWCVACIKLEKNTFPDSNVVNSLNGIITAKIDYNNEAEFIEKYEIVGLPAILFIKPDGTEIRTARIDGYLTPEEFVEHVRKEVFASPLLP